MTRLAMTGWVSALLGLAISGTAAAQTAPDDEVPAPSQVPDTTTPTPTTPDTTSTPDATSTPDTTTTPDTDLDGTSSDTTTNPGATVNTDATAPADVDVDVRTPDPITTGTTDYTYAPTNVVVEDDDDDGPLSGIGIAVAAGGGAGGFVNDDLRGTTDVGGDWDVRATIGTRSPIAFEGSYIGSAQNITALGLDNDALLVGNGVQGALRINATLNLPIQPFAFAGAAWRRYDLANTDQNLSDVSDSDDVLEIPLGVGIAGRWNGLILDARGEYRVARNADLLPEVNADSLTSDSSDFAAMNRWGIKATVGLEF